MKQLLLLTILVLAFCLQLFGQANLSQCPEVNIEDKGVAVFAGGGTIFEIWLIDETRFTNIEYKWTTSIGTILRGQGTRLINVAVPQETQGQTIKVSIEIKGLPLSCKNSDSKLFKVFDSPSFPRTIIDIDRKVSYKISLDEALERIHELSVLIKESKIFVIFRVTNKTERNWANLRKQQILKSLKKLNIHKDRVVIEIEKGNFFETIFDYFPPPKN